MVGVLDCLVREFAAGEAEAVTRLYPEDARPESGSILLADASSSEEKTSNHPLIVKALRFIEGNLSDPDLSASRIANALGVSANYFGHLFFKEFGLRVGGVIVRRRMGKARILLTTTDWQIKQIALDTGHVNPNWFSHLFRQITGVTPNEFRTISRRSIA